jgi:hypothetical protein
MRQTEKHTPYFNLIDAVESGECPVCTRVCLRVKQFFETMLYQNVNDRRLRAELRANGGFCPPHAHQMATHRDGLAVAIMHLELLEAAHRNNGIVPVSAQKGNAASVPTCPACRIVTEESNTTVDLLSQYGDDPQFIEVYQKSAGLCLPHFQRLMQRTRRPPRVLIDRQHDQLTSLITHTRKFIDGENVAARVRPELTREDRLVWKTIIDRFYGKPGALD